MDYNNKFIKYKTKYLKSQNFYLNYQFGGNNYNYLPCKDNMYWTFYLILFGY